MTQSRVSFSAINADDSTRAYTRDEISSRIAMLPSKELRHMAIMVTEFVFMELNAISRFVQFYFS